MHSDRAPAKINLGLHVLRRRVDNYHDIQTVLVPIGWYDTVTVRAADDVSMTCSDPSLPTDDRNLCMQAARLLGRTAGVSAGAAIHLEKHIPYGAGLGGGSSDAAVTLRLLCRLWDLSYTTGDLHAAAARLGADVPFFLEHRAAYATGRGGELDYFDDYRCPFTIVVAKPPISVSTPEAYDLVTPKTDPRPDLRELVAANDLDRWRDELTNDFEQPVFDRYPELAALKQELLDLQAGYAALSGSGSAVFGLFSDRRSGHQAAARLRRREDLTVWCGGVLDGGIFKDRGYIP